METRRWYILYFDAMVVLQSVMIHHTIKEKTLPIFKEWLKSATEKGGARTRLWASCNYLKHFFFTERSVLMEMLEVAHDNSEEMRLSRVRI